jgi:hypothetical protein
MLTFFRPGTRAIPVCVLIAVLVMTVVVLFGCGGSGDPGQQVANTDACPSCSGAQGPPTPPPQSVNVVATVSMLPNVQGAPERFFDANNAEMSAQTLSSMIQSIPKDGSSAMQINVLAASAADASLAAQPKVGVGFPVGCYYIRISWEQGYVGGCIKRNDQWHLGFTVRNNCKETMPFNGHLCGWWQNGPQFGIYNSANGWCAQSRGTFTEIKNKIAAGLVAAGIVSWLADSIADTVAGVTVSAFAF